MRKFSDLPKSNQKRIAAYIKLHRDVSSKELSIDLSILEASITSVKAIVSKNATDEYSESWRKDNQWKD